MLFWSTEREVVPMEPAKLKSARPESEEAIRRLRDDLGAVPSCALLMAHAPAADVRSRYLRTLNKANCFDGRAIGTAGAEDPVDQLEVGGPAVGAPHVGAPYDASIVRRAVASGALSHPV